MDQVKFEKDRLLFLNRLEEIINFQLSQNENLGNFFHLLKISFDARAWSSFKVRRCY